MTQPTGDEAKTAQAVADARELIDAFSANPGIDADAAKLGGLMTARLEPSPGLEKLDEAETLDLATRFSFLIYGFAVYGAAATIALREATGWSDDAVEEAITNKIDAWLRTES